MSVKTVKGVIGLLKKIAYLDVELMNGYEKMPEELKEELKFMRAEAYNIIGAYEDLTPQKKEQ